MSGSALPAKARDRSLGTPTDMQLRDISASGTKPDATAEDLSENFLQSMQSDASCFLDLGCAEVERNITCFLSAT